MAAYGVRNPRIPLAQLVNRKIDISAGNSDFRPRIMVVFGTRPEVIKLAPVIRALRKRKIFDVYVCSTGQHREMLDQTIKVFALSVDSDLDLMVNGQTLPAFAAKAISALDREITKVKPSAIIVQGDTTTTFVASLVAYYHKIPLGHVEAGLRTNSRFSPFPEEINRRLTSVLSEWHFAPTEHARTNLLAEGIDEACIWLTGNTIVDALQYIGRQSLELTPNEFADLPHSLVDALFSESHRIVLVTCHRRENFGDSLANVCEAIRSLAHEFSETLFVFPVHLNPRVKTPVFRLLGNHPNILLIEPLDYRRFIRIMSTAELILTDSGGIQEEVLSLGVRTLVMRDHTERMEGLDGLFGETVKLVGTERGKIVRAARTILGSGSVREISPESNPYGDGRAAEWICSILEDNLFGTQSVEKIAGESYGATVG